MVSTRWRTQEKQQLLVEASPWGLHTSRRTCRGAEASTSLPAERRRGSKAERWAGPHPCLKGAMFHIPCLQGDDDITRAAGFRNVLGGCSSLLGNTRQAGAQPGAGSARQTPDASTRRPGRPQLRVSLPDSRRMRVPVLTTLRPRRGASCRPGASSFSLLSLPLFRVYPTVLIFAIIPGHHPYPLYWTTATQPPKWSSLFALSLHCHLPGT